MLVKIPKWKMYLYTLSNRIKWYTLINSGRLGIGLTKTELAILNSMVNKYLTKGVLRRVKAIRYDKLIHTVLVDYAHIATKEELEIATKLLWINTLNLEDLPMEIKKLKEFALEVGIPSAKVKGIGEEELSILIIKNIDTSVTYSDPLRAWYESGEVDPYFDIVDGLDQTVTTTNTMKTDKGATIMSDKKEIIDTLDGITKIAELKDFATQEDFAMMFTEIDLDAYKNQLHAKKLKAAMMEAIEAYELEGGSNGDNPFDDEYTEAIIEEVTNAETFEDIVELMEADPDVEEYLGNVIDFNQEMTVDEFKNLIFQAFGAEVDDNGGADDGGLKETLEGMKVPEIRAWAKENDVDLKGAGLKKDKIIEHIMAQAGDTNEGGDDEGTDLTPELVEQLVEADDKETLISICDQLEITLTAMKKKSAKAMGKLLMEAAEALAAEGGGEEETTEEESSGDDESIYATMEAMIKEGATVKDLEKEMKDAYEAIGMKVFSMRKSIAAFHAIVVSDFNLE